MDYTWVLQYLLSLADSPYLDFVQGFSQKDLDRSFQQFLLGVCRHHMFLSQITFGLLLTDLCLPSVALATITTIMIKLTVEAIIASVLVEILIPYIKRAGLTFK